MIYVKYKNKLERNKLTREDINAFNIQIIKMKSHQYHI